MATNLKELLIDITKLPAKVEGMLPEAAPKLSTTLVDIAGKLPETPDFPVEIPALPEPPELPAMPEMPGLGKPFGLGRRYVPGVEVTRASVSAKGSVTPLVQAYTQPIEGVVGEVKVRRGM